MTIERRLFPARPRLNRPVSSRASVITNPNQLDWILATVIETNTISQSIRVRAARRDSYQFSNFTRTARTLSLDRGVARPPFSTPCPPFRCSFPSGSRRIASSSVIAHALRSEPTPSRRRLGRLAKHESIFSFQSPSSRRRARDVDANARDAKRKNTHAIISRANATMDVASVATARIVLS